MVTAAHTGGDNENDRCYLKNKSFNVKCADALQQCENMGWTSSFILKHSFFYIDLDMHLWVTLICHIVSSTCFVLVHWWRIIRVLHDRVPSVAPHSLFNHFYRTMAITNMRIWQCLKFALNWPENTESHPAS